MSFIDYAGGLPLSEQLKLLNQALSDQRATRYLDVASTTAMLYDILITLDQEASHVWKASWSYMKVLYFVVRYPVLIESIVWLVHSLDITASDLLCKFGTYLFIWATLIFLIPLQIIIFMRTIAIWERKRVIIIPLGILLSATDLTILITLSRLMHTFTFSISPLLQPLFGCDSSLLHLTPSSSIAAWCAVIIFDTTIFFLTLAKGIKSYKPGRDSLFTVLIRDGFAYYAVMLVLAILNLVFYCGLPPEQLGLSNAFSPLLHASFSIVGSRLILNLRRAAASRNLTGTTLDGDVGGMKLVDLSSSSVSAGTSGLYSSSEFGLGSVVSRHCPTEDNNMNEPKRDRTDVEMESPHGDSSPWPNPRSLFTA